MSTVADRPGQIISKTGTPADQVREDYVPKESFISPRFVALEREKLWPRLWQIACRVEELKKPGDFVVYEVAGQSILVVRQRDESIRAFHNVCQHRGRILEDRPHGNAPAFRCGYHGWTWKIDGATRHIQDEGDWAGCPAFGKQELRLKRVQVDCWGGFVFICMDETAEPLAAYLGEAKTIIDPLEMHHWRYRWYKTTILPCNWKTALEGFNEAYHVAATHPQILETSGDDQTRSRAYGRHGTYRYTVDRRPVGAPSSRTGKPMPNDLRPGIIKHFDNMEETLRAMFTPRSTEATRRLLDEVPGEAPTQHILAEMGRFHREAAEAEGAGWPALTAEQGYELGTNWHIFPNHVFLPTRDGSIAYRARPNGEDPHSCIFDIWSLARYAPDKEPPLEREYYPDWTIDTVERFGLILSQDFANFGQVQKGMQSMGFEAARPNPLQESEIPNFHRHYLELLFD
ncbi:MULTISPECIES: aromatic ring-hydroxylating oxygenase subunit alpha [unclassified Sphingobium]|uniref:aromatic ring-hydroxylating oxygenase subunit alpha n=1 Tax=unclassified Sphingobium TaxID=2611147 RepID=UPI000D15D466|nr:MULTISPECIES: aromatic ring-hydroxylating dioxygenase subunit alpha [unclassified Sphingobium]MBG6119974.1 phenylpropionate dioxygenase-like ring-hydroxylating dioxygenase large terminal subunit [Sphingobium sp. JAI105]PSO11859.1 (2Fe-2S)-binding protein [Sphingobium sp. AEW4]TWC99587.1 Rieske-like 2Fe-2S protein [Sphingobium sp. AEW010]TWD18976.1 Rieske-like 2Fe-2S protein [Sphingobium sp. AEW013]TWD21847.1 Rieske-like 2Fe-2S protein [Sphingobium sp. AEW001]